MDRSRSREIDEHSNANLVKDNIEMKEKLNEVEGELDRLKKIAVSENIQRTLEQVSTILL